MDPRIVLIFGAANSPLNPYYRIGARYADDLAWWYMKQVA
jgi:hypothetical protein